MANAHWLMALAGLVMTLPANAIAQDVAEEAAASTLPSTEPDSDGAGQAAHGEGAPPEVDDPAPSSFPNDGFVTTFIRVSPDIVDRREEIIAFIEAQSGWAIGDDSNAEFELVPNPEYYQDLLFSRIKRFQFDRMRALHPSPAMDIADIMVWNDPNPSTVWSDGRGKGRINAPNRPTRPEWGPSTPVPVDLGPADGPDLLAKLGEAMIPVARHHALLGLVNDQGRGFKLCISHEPAPEGACPLADGNDPSVLMYFKPFYIRASGDDSLPGNEVTFLAVAPDRRIVHLNTVPMTRIVTIDREGQEVASEAMADNYHDPATLDELGHYQIIAIASPDSLDPRIWSLGPGDPLPQDICATEIQRRLCETMRGTYNTIGNRPLATGLTHFRVFTDMYIGVAPVGGSVARLEESRWQAQLYIPREGGLLEASGPPSPGGVRRLNFEKSHKCGGSYLGNGLIVTAAHCIDRMALGEMEVRLGTRDISKGGSNFPIVSMVIHRDYRRRRDKVDIALIRIRTDSRLSTLIRKGLVAPVALAPAGQRLRTGTAVDLTGWGFTKPTEAGTNPLLDIHGRTQRNAPRLMIVAMRTRPAAQCTAYRQLSVYADKDIVCANSAIPGRGACFSDSGGPLTRKAGRRRELVGIISAGIGCAVDGIPSVYTRIASFRSWIERAKIKARQPGKHRIP